MSAQSRKHKIEHAEHDYERVDRKVDGIEYNYLQCKVCGYVIYPMRELQKLWDYSEKHQFMFVHDWVLALMYAQPMPVVGITCFEKMLFLTFIEFAPDHNIPTENPGFKAYKFGPYSERIEDVIIGFEDAGAIIAEGRKGASGEYFELTKEGVDLAASSFNKLSQVQKHEYQKARLDWHQLGAKGLMKYVYKNYPDYAKESVVFERVLHGRRVTSRTKTDEIRVEEQ